MGSIRSISTIEFRTNVPLPNNLIDSNIKHRVRVDCELLKYNYTAPYYCPAFLSLSVFFKRKTIFHSNR